MAQILTKKFVYTVEWWTGQRHQSQVVFYRFALETDDASVAIVSILESMADIRGRRDSSIESFGSLKGFSGPDYYLWADAQRGAL
ncbi:MAG: hypothetical protein LAP21_08305 [Acidobacteriia bacterium]|nr:hypothetical protein [Terriglobia bacterium]